MSEIVISVARDFSPLPGLRYESQGPNSGKRFREEVLLPRFLEARAANKQLRVDLDGTEGYTTSFLEESFGGLARTPGVGIEAVKQTLIVSCSQSFLVEDVWWDVEQSVRPPGTPRPLRPLPA